VQLGTILL